MVIKRVVNLLKTVGLSLRVIREYRNSTAEVGFVKIRSILSLLRRKNIAVLRRVASVSQIPAERPKVLWGDRVCFVLGNGPSLFTDISEKLDLLHMGDSFCVNEFAESEFYENIQPKYYIFADSWYWSSSSPKNVILARNRLFGAMLDKTSWPLIICVPFEAKEFFEGIFSKTKNIRLSFYNNFELVGERSIVNILFDLELGMPSLQNVLIPALFLSLRFGYKKIILLGADHSWHETVAVDGASRVCLSMRHFYSKNEKSVPWSMDGTAENIWTMGGVFHALGRMFEGYWKIEEYACHLGAQIYNASSKTYIDAFKRKPLEEIHAEYMTNLSKET